MTRMRARIRIVLRGAALAMFAVAAMPVVAAPAGTPAVVAGDASSDAEAPIRIGVVDVARVMNESPQASRAKTSMAKQFAARKNALEARASGLRQDIERLQQDGPVMSEADRKALEADIRDRQRELQMQRSKYNDDVAAAEEKEFEQMRGDILDVIENYARDNDFDLLLGDSVLYTTDTVDVTDEILAELQDR